MDLLRSIQPLILGSMESIDRFPTSTVWDHDHRSYGICILAFFDIFGRSIMDPMGWTPMHHWVRRWSLVFLVTFSLCLGIFCSSSGQIQPRYIRCSFECDWSIWIITWEWLGILETTCPTCSKNTKTQGGSSYLCVGWWPVAALAVAAGLRCLWAAGFSFPFLRVAHPPNSPTKVFVWTKLVSLFVWLVAVVVASCCFVLLGVLVLVLVVLLVVVVFFFCCCHGTGLPFATPGECTVLLGSQGCEADPSLPGGICLTGS